MTEKQARLTDSEESSLDGEYGNSSTDDSYENESTLAYAEIWEEEIHREYQNRKRQRTDNTDAFCEICFLNNWTVLKKKVASYLCYVCEQYTCEECFKGHESHKLINLVSKESERDGQIKSFMDEMKNESEGDDMLEIQDVSLVDRVNVRHRLDRREDCGITGLCGLNDTAWVVCDCNNHCIKLFSVGSNMLQRYIRFESEPWGVTKIKIKREPTVLDIISVASGISVKNQSDPLEQCLLAVVLPWKQKIIFIDVTKCPAVKTKCIETEANCFSIDFCDDMIFVVCSNGNIDYYWFVSVMSTDGVKIKTINTDLYDDWSVPNLAVCNGRVFLTDACTDRIFCINDKENMVSHKTIDLSQPYGISVDTDTNTVYICAEGQDKLYQADSSLGSFKCLLDLKALNLMKPKALCFFKDKLYVSHNWGSIHANFVDLVRVL